MYIHIHRLSVELFEANNPKWKREYMHMYYMYVLDHVPAGFCTTLLIPARLKLQVRTEYKVCTDSLLTYSIYLLLSYRKGGTVKEQRTFHESVQENSKKT